MPFEMSQIHIRLKAEDLPDNAFILFFSGRETIRKEEGGFPSSASIVPLQKYRRGNMYRTGILNGKPCIGVELEKIPDVLPAGLIRIPSRFILAQSPEEEWQALCRTREIVFWLNRHQFCGQCGAKMSASDRDAAMVCPVCNTRFYPQIAPAVIIAVTRHAGREILLAHNRNFEPDIHGLIAGFVEAGETVEQAVKREIREETSIEVRNIRYISSQTWPFPNSLMLAFEAEYASGEAVPDGSELDRLGWFPPDHLPPLPQPGSIAAAIITRWRDRFLLKNKNS